MLDLLQGVRVLSLSPHLPGSATARVLADLGADVINVELPGRGDVFRGLPPLIDGLGVWEVALNRGKRSLALDFRRPDGREVFDRALASADVLVEVSRPGGLERYGLDEPSLRPQAPGLVYCSVTGYGQNGPYRDLPSHGMNVDAAAGTVTVERDANGRPEIKRAAAVGIDNVATAAATAILAALVRRASTGEGVYLDASSWDAAIGANRFFATTLNFGEPVELNPFNDKSVHRGPKYNVYATKDDRVILLAPIEEKFWRQFCIEVGREDWIGRGNPTARFDYGNDDIALRDDIQEIIRTRDLADWLESLLAADVPAAPVVPVADLPADPHVAAREMIVGSNDDRYPNVRYVRPAVVDVLRPLTASPPPMLGEHTVEILTELGYNEAERARLLADEVVAVSSS